jgi:Exo70 exocyst complex subunit
LADFFVSLPNLETQHTQIYADIRGGYLSNSLSDISAGVLSSAQGRRDVPSLTPGTFIRATISMLEFETETINSIFQGLGQQETVFEKTAIAPMGLFSRTFKALNTQIRSSPSQNLPLTLSILDDLTFAQDMISRSTVSSGSVEVLRKEINTLEREAKGVGAVGVGDVVEDVRRRGQGVLSLPSDGGIIDLTSEVSLPLNSLSFRGLSANFRQ